MLGKRQHLISKLGREDFKRLKIQLQKLLRHQIAFLKYSFDELRANESETYGLNSPSNPHGLKNEGEGGLANIFSVFSNPQALYSVRWPANLDAAEFVQC